MWVIIETQHDIWGWITDFFLLRKNKANKMNLLDINPFYVILIIWSHPLHDRYDTCLSFSQSFLPCRPTTSNGQKNSLCSNRLLWTCVLLWEFLIKRWNLNGMHVTKRTQKVRKSPGMLRGMLDIYTQLIPLSLSFLFFVALSLLPNQSLNLYKGNKRVACSARKKPMEFCPEVCAEYLQWAHVVFELNLKNS